MLADDVIDQKIAFGETFERGSLSSLHHDLITGLKLEPDALFGELARSAVRHTVSVSACEVIYSLLRPWEIALQPGGGDDPVKQDGRET